MCNICREGEGWCLTTETYLGSKLLRSMRREWMDGQEFPAKDGEDRQILITFTFRDGALHMVEKVNITFPLMQETMIVVQGNAKRRSSHVPALPIHLIQS